MTMYFFDDDAQNHYELGMNYLSGGELELNYKKAFHHLELAAKGEHSEAQSELGKMYAQGLGMTPDPTKAVEWFQMSSRKGNPSGKYNLSVMYRGGHGIEANPVLERLLLGAAAEGGLAVAQYMLGLSYDPPLRGRDIGMAAHWYEKAAAQGFEAAQERLDALRDEE